jgi:hypothetical protein
MTMVPTTLRRRGIVGPGRRTLLAASAALAACLAACTPADPLKELAVSELEAYWIIDTVSGDTQYIAPAVRLRITNVGQATHYSVEATATFRHAGDKDTWGSGFNRVTQPGKPLKPGESAIVVMVSDARYHSEATPEQMFGHKLFRDATVEVFLRLSGSGWAKAAAAPVTRRIGAKSVQEFAPPQPPKP